ncbi:probable G-protein coupled receptor 101 [Ptychodera flava]|uniref:probable G-protein coupled receptor 101 n=1 Tax=Ptychodera flava TaxID=63121 RepID=UPI00396A46BF
MKQGINSDPGDNGTFHWDNMSEEIDFYFQGIDCTSGNFSRYCPGNVEIALKVTLLIIEIFLSFFGNTLVLVVLYRNPKLMNIANKFVCNLLVADLFQSVVVIPFAIVSTVYSEWIYSESWCKAVACFTHIFSFAAVYTIVIVSIDRYLAILHPLSYHSRMTPATCTNLIVFTWVIAVLQSTPPLYGWGEFGWHASRSTCSVLWYKTDNVSFSYTVYIALTTFILPVLIMLRGYWKIFRAAYRQNEIHPMPETNAGEINMNQPKQRINGQFRSKRRFKRDMKAAKVVFIVMGSFIVSIGPYTVVNFLESHQKPLGAWPTVLHTISLVLLFCQCCVHPCIYGYMHRSIRRDLVYLVCRNKCKCLLPRPRKDSIMNNRMSAAYTDEWRTSGATLSHIPSQFCPEMSEMAVRDLSPIQSLAEVESTHQAVQSTKVSNGSTDTNITTLDNDAEQSRDTVFTISGQIKSKVAPTIHVRFTDA